MLVFLGASEAPGSLEMDGRRGASFLRSRALGRALGVPSARVSRLHQCDRLLRASFSASVEQCDALVADLCARCWRLPLALELFGSLG
mmetsp:Transcript_12583/g.37792  ORF Transcript_12583/g.37792 Transcript_12583/m.37792 type:complete len:88 (+) Transcript_12583:1191-1454(+)